MEKADMEAAAAAVREALGLYREELEGTGDPDGEDAPNIAVLDDAERGLATLEGAALAVVALKGEARRVASEALEALEQARQL